MLLQLGIDRSLVQSGAAAAVNDRARLRRRCCASSLTAPAAPKQGLAMRSMPVCASLGYRDDLISVRTLQDRSRWSDRSIPDARHPVQPSGPKGSPLCLELASQTPSWQRPFAAASTSRTYGRKRSGQTIPLQRLASRGPSTYGLLRRGLCRPQGCYRLLAKTELQSFSEFRVSL